MPLKPSQLNSPSFVQSLLAGQREVRATLSQVSDTNIHSTSSFFYDRPGDGLKSTQQLNVDWSKFENHTFFNSAEASVNVAFDTIINRFPFDGTKRDLEVFFERLTGFERWVYDRFPKNVGYLNFSGSSAVGAVGTSISVSGLAGTLYPTLSKDRTAVNVLDPGLRSFSAEMQILLPSMSNDYQVVCQKLSGQSNGFSLYLAPTSSWTQCLATFAVVSGSESLFTTAVIPKNQFNHVCAVFDRTARKNKVQIYLNEQLAAESTSSYAFGNLGTSAAPMLIGSGTKVLVNGITISPTSTLSASIDEFRFFHEPRTVDLQRAYARKSIFPIPSLKLYFKFNEPSGTLISSNVTADSGIVIDSSGNELHSKISNFSFGLRSTGSVASPLTGEKLAFSPVLFPAFPDLVTLNTVLLTTASTYDQANPNLITKLIPSHYLLDGQLKDGLSTVDGDIVSSYTKGTLPGTGQLGASQLLASFLYVWAKFFDEMKLFVDAFAGLKHVSYDGIDSTPDLFLPMLLKSYGFNVPAFFSDASIQQFIDAENIQTDFGTNSHALQFVRNQIHRRILVNLLDIMKSKGTVHAVKSLIRSVGIDPDNSFRVREFGGPTRRALDFVREDRTQPHLVLDVRDRSGYVVTPPLSGSRVETGFPSPAGTMVQQAAHPPHGISNLPSDGLFTSGSFTVEALYRYPVGFQLIPLATQSLFRLVVTGTNFSSLSDGWGTLVNVIATSGSNNIDIPAVRAYVRPSPNTSYAPPLLVMQVTGVNLFDGNRWSVSLGRQRNDEISSNVSSSYFLRLARQEGGVIQESYVTSSYFVESGSMGAIPAWNLVSPSTNASGAYLVIGNRTVPAGASGSAFMYLNDSTNVASTEARAGTFEGQVSMVRFWSKALSDDEWREHVRNPKSLGVDSPHLSFNFVTALTGAFGRLRVDVPVEQTVVSASSSGTIILTDYSQNNLHMAGTGFSALRRVLLTDLFRYSLISPAFDEATANNKVRVRSYQSFARVQEASPIAAVAPVYDPDPTEPPVDDTRFSIEFSVIDALNRDIISIFSTLDELDNVLGNPELLFSSDYPGLQNLRDVYFHRLTSKVNLRAFFEYFKWFDTSISSFIEQLIPRKTRFFGTNFVIESHMLERAKMRYHHIDNYLGDSDRIATVRDILVQLLDGGISKH